MTGRGFPEKIPLPVKRWRWWAPGKYDPDEVLAHGNLADRTRLMLILAALVDSQMLTAKCHPLTQ
jgi:hypothetical protein